ncbi:MAG: NADH-quinone oxidoreductase subunit B, partial [Bartonella sp.]|nr:NADH-quinone oxidoreductase subunit B [Bartonella sp.]
MELGFNNSTVVAPKSKGIIGPDTGKLVGSNDKFFSDINAELGDK